MIALLIGVNHFGQNNLDADQLVRVIQRGHVPIGLEWQSTGREEKQAVRVPIQGYEGVWRKDPDLGDVYDSKIGGIGVGKNLGLIAAKRNGQTGILAVGRNGKTYFLEHANTDCSFWLDLEGNFAFVYSAKPSQLGRTKIYSTDKNALTFLGIVPGRALQAFGKEIATTGAPGWIRYFSVASGKPVESKSQFSKRLKSLFDFRSKYWQTDPFKNRNNGGYLPSSDTQSPSVVQVSPDAGFWFEEHSRAFISEGAHDSSKYFAGSTILSSKGLQWQWKFNDLGFCGGRFISNSVFRFYRWDRFRMGFKKFSWCEPGGYDVDLNSKTFKRLVVRFPSLKKEIFSGGYIVIR